MMTQQAMPDTSSTQPTARTREISPVGWDPLSCPIDLMGASMPFARNAEVYGEGEPAEYLYKVISGAVRTYKVLTDGRRQIGAFYLAGDMFGLEIGEVLVAAHGLTGLLVPGDQCRVGDRLG